jgi:hypothetical protein
VGLLSWHCQPNGDWWADMPSVRRDGTRWVKPRVMDVRRHQVMRNQATAEAEVVGEWWDVSMGAHRLGPEFSGPLVAMKWADCWWDEYAARRKL